MKLDFFTPICNFQEPFPRLITKVPHSDERGFFVENYKQSDFIEKGIADNFVQDNMSVSNRGVFRGLHFQRKPYEMAKLVSVLSGEIIDFIVDIRPTSLTYKRWKQFYLTSENQKMLYVPSGFLHGFISLGDKTIVSYKCSCEYNYQYDAGIRYDDPDIKIEFPFEMIKYISEKDKNLPYLKDIEDYYRGFAK